MSIKGREKALNAREQEKWEYKGRQYNKYEATQRQRQLETTLRTQRQEIRLLEEGGAAEDDIITARARYRVTSAEYARYSKEMDIPQQRERVTMDGLGNVGVGKYTQKHTASNDKLLTNRAKSDIIRSEEVKSLEQAKKRDYKVLITDEAIAKVGKVKLSDFTEEQMSKMQEKHKNLLRLSKEQNDSNEILLIDDLVMKSEVQIFGDEFSVSPASNPFAVSVIGRADKYSLIYMHNHPSTNTFSVADIDTFICEAPIKTMSVVTNQGKVYVLNKTSRYNYNNARQLMLDVYRSFGSETIDNKEFVKRFLNECSKGGIEYAKS